LYIGSLCNCSYLVSDYVKKYDINKLKHMLAGLIVDHRAKTHFSLYKCPLVIIITIWFYGCITHNYADFDFMHIVCSRYCRSWLTEVLTSNTLDHHDDNWYDATHDIHYMYARGLTIVDYIIRWFTVLDILWARSSTTIPLLHLLPQKLMVGVQ